MSLRGPGTSITGEGAKDEGLMIHLVWKKREYSTLLVLSTSCSNLAYFYTVCFIAIFVNMYLDYCFLKYRFTVILVKSRGL